MGRCNLVYKTKNNLKIRKAYLKLEDVNSTQIHENMEDKYFTISMIIFVQLFILL